MPGENILPVPKAYASTPTRIHTRARARTMQIKIEPTENVTFQTKPICRFIKYFPIFETAVFGLILP